MVVSRRTFLHSAAATAASLAPATRLLAEAPSEALPLPGQGRAQPPDRFDPWVEVIPANLAHNVTTLRRLGGRPILAVIKNHGYGLDYRIVARLLDSNPDVEGFALVRAEEAIALREQGVRKPILVMARVADSVLSDLATRGIAPAMYADDDPARLARLPTNGEPIGIQAYIDTGMSRMGIPYHRAIPFLQQIASRRNVVVLGTFMTFTEDAEFDREQLARFQAFTRDASAAGLRLGKLHAASSHSIFHHRDVGFDLVRPGMSLYGGYPDRFDEERKLAELRPAFRLRARVVRTDRLRVGDGVGYGRTYVAARPTWIATIPLGHGDGYPRGAVKGARALVGERLYPVIGAVSASHSIIEVGDDEAVRLGDIATFLGPDRPEIHPNEVARVTGSVYDLLMHLNPALPRFVV
jgi:alanine racemase